MCRSIVRGVRFRMLAAIALGLTLGCSSPPSDKPVNSELTQGNVQLHLVKGQTTKAQVLEAFGAPNLTTRDAEGLEVWTYERSAREAKSNSAFWTVILAGSSSSGFEESSRNMILIIKFDAKDVVNDFNSRASSF
jgi:outer membrane protein assembly factor BamE (lipoprotein component of BamABCDE complex)